MWAFIGPLALGPIDGEAGLFLAPSSQLCSHNWGPAQVAPFYGQDCGYFYRD